MVYFIMLPNNLKIATAALLSSHKPAHRIPLKPKIIPQRALNRRTCYPYRNRPLNPLRKALVTFFMQHTGLELVIPIAVKNCRKNWT